MIGRKSTDVITVKDVPADEFIKCYADHLKKSNDLPLIENHFFIKTGHSREISPHDDDWFYTRAAALARKIYLRPNLGVGTLQHIYGKNGRNGHRRNHHTKGSGKIIRYILKRLEDIGILMRYNDPKNKGINVEEIDTTDENFPRIISPKGQK